MVNDVKEEKAVIVYLRCDGIFFEMVNDKKSVIVCLRWDGIYLEMVNNE